MCRPAFTAVTVPPVLPVLLPDEPDEPPDEPELLLELPDVLPADPADEPPTVGATIIVARSVPDVLTSNATMANKDLIWGYIVKLS